MAQDYRDKCSKPEKNCLAKFNRFLAVEAHGSRHADCPRCSAFLINVSSFTGSLP